MNRTLPCYLARIAVIALLLLTSCAPLRDRRTLNDMEALMPERPDSALAVLRGLQPRDLPGFHVRPLHALLLSEALDKNYIDLTDDSLALAAHKYYGEHGSKLHRLKSWYYLGRIRFNAGNYAEAVICYNKALEYAEALTNYHYMGLINREIANAYDSVWDEYHAVDYIQKSIDAFQQGNEIRYSEYSKLALARLFRNQKDDNNSLRILNELTSHSSDAYILASAYELIALIQLSKKNPDIEDIEVNMNRARIGVFLPENASRLSNLAIVRQMAGDSDSALFYISKASNAVNSMEDSISVVFSRYTIANTAGDVLQAKTLLEDYLALQDPAIYDKLKQSISFYQGNYYQNESRMNALKARMRAQSYGIVIILLVLLALYLLSKNRKQRAQIIEEMARTSEVQQDLIIMSNENKEIGRAVATLFENRLNILQTLSDKYDLLDEAYEKKRRENTEKLSRDELVYSFRDMMRDLRKDKDINISMEEILNSWKGGIMKKFRSVFGADSSSGIRMSEEDFELAPYYFSGMKQKTISYLTGFTENAIKVRKYRIKQKIENLNATFAEEKTLFLSNMQ